MHSKDAAVLFLEDENNKLQQLHKECAEASWMVNTTGEEKWQQKEAEAEATYKLYCSDSTRFKRIKDFLDTTVEGSVEHRQLQRLYQEAAENQLTDDILKEIVSRTSTLSNRMTTFRGEIDGRKVTENDIRETLLSSSDNELRRKMWEASKQIGRVISEDLLQLIKLKNKAAQTLGYRNYYELSFELQELDLDEIFSIFKELKEITDAPFRMIKDEIDSELASKLNVAVCDLRPWHYSDAFFQDAPAVSGANLTPVLQKQDIEKLTSDTFASLHMDIDELLKNGDLYEREGKNPYAFCQDVDRKGDIRVLCNIKQNQYWMETMLHEYGHAVYDKYIDPKLPFILRTPAHILMTEAVAMFFGRVTKFKEWLQKFLQLPGNKLEDMLDSTTKSLRRQMFITARWVLTFVFFERALYEDPDQDLNKLWWDLVQDIQYQSPPDNRDEPDWAAKMHFTMAPVYYHNYLLGELVASQFHDYIDQNVSDSIFTKQTGQFFINEVFRHGDRYTWQELLEKATGHRLSPTYFVKQFV